MRISDGRSLLRYTQPQIRTQPGQVPAGLIILVIRADFEALCGEYLELANAVQHRYLVTSMTPRQLQLAITEPAKKAGTWVDDTLVDRLLREIRAYQPASSPAGSRHGMASGAGVLPLLSHALDQAWRNRSGDVVDLADYERIGGIERGVAASANVPTTLSRTARSLRRGRPSCS